MTIPEFNKFSPIGDVREYCAHVLRHNYHLYRNTVVAASTVETIELSLNFLCYEIEALRRNLLAIKTFQPISIPGRVKVVFATDESVTPPH